ncbi:MAG TPA: hypothetical protein VF331_06350 [Polyangiales bacterium]
MLAATCLLAPGTAHAGPPYETDDPEPVDYLHWELYLATQHEHTSDGTTGTAPHLEINLGAAPNLQLHLIAPLAYARPSSGLTTYGPGDVELGAKLRFVEEGERRPMVGTFPLVELPAGSESRGLGRGHLRVFVPLWLQKSFGPWTTYGGGGYWVNPGVGNQNYWYVGAQAQRRLSRLVTLGGEVFYTTADRVAGDGNLRFNLGLVLDFTGHQHLLLSAGRSIVGGTRVQAYLAYQLTL